MGNTVTTPVHRNVPASVRTGKSVQSTFRKGSVRSLVVGYLKQKRTYGETEKFVNGLGASYTDILRFLRKTGHLTEEKGTLRWKVS